MDIAVPSLQRRALARLIDVVVVASATVALGSLLDFSLLWLVVGALGILAYFAGSDAAFGMSVGKALTGLKVVGPDGERPSVQAAARREAFTMLGAIPFVGPILAMVAWITIVVTVRNSPTGQGLHDRWAGGTRVVPRG